VIEPLRTFLTSLRAAKRLHELRALQAQADKMIELTEAWSAEVRRLEHGRAQADVQPLRESFADLERALADAQRQRDLADAKATEALAESTAYRVCVDVAKKACDNLGIVLRPGDPVVAALFMLAAEVARLRPTYESARRWKAKPFAEGRAADLVSVVTAAEQEAP